MRGRLLLLALALLPALGAPPARAQEPAPAPEGAESEPDRLLRLALEASPVVRPQAARRFVALGAPAAERVLARTGGETAGYAALSQDLLEVLGEVGSDAVRADLWEALSDRDFPWRPSVARTLARTALEGEHARVLALCDDRVAAVRAAAVEGLGTLGRRADAPRLRALLGDPDDRVRRAAAVQLDRWGQTAALWILVEDLKRDDRFFEIDTGRTARSEALRLLAPRIGGEHGFEPREGPADPANRAALERIEERVRALAGDPPEPPRAARAAPPRTDADVLGLELRSCRRGELFLRWTDGDRLLVGTGNARALALPAGTTARLAARAADLFGELGDRELFGRPGCDVEVYHLAPPGLAGARARRVSKGPEPPSDLRPGPLAALARELCASLPADLRADAAAALDAIGGSLAGGGGG